MYSSAAKFGSVASTLRMHGSCCRRCRNATLNSHDACPSLHHHHHKPSIPTFFAPQATTFVQGTRHNAFTSSLKSILSGPVGIPSGGTICNTKGT